MHLTRSRDAALALALLVLLSILTLGVPTAATAAEEPAWIRGSIRLNLRAGAGTKFKILDSVETGDEMRVLARKESWTRVRTSEGETGWIPAGYLETEPPPQLRLDQLENETEALRAKLSALQTEAGGLRESNATLNSTDGAQREQIESLQIENFELHAGRRSQEWITGALILSGGMALGAFLHRNSTRRPSSRIRL